MPSYSTLPHIGVGINHQKDREADILDHLSHIDFIEINTERFFYEAPSPTLDAILQEIPLTFHGLSLSLGSTEALAEHYFINLKTVLSHFAHLWFSDHLATTREKNIEFRGLMPVAFTEQNAESIIKKINTIKNLSHRPFILENIAYYYPMPKSTLSESQFITSIVLGADCGLLLDVNNLLVNAHNHRYDHHRYLSDIPLDRVIEIHLSGGESIEGMMFDTHSAPITKESFDLFRMLCKKTPFKGVVIERDAKLSHFSDILDEIKAIKNIVKTQRS